MNYKIILSKDARKFITKQTQQTQKRIMKSIEKLPYGGDIDKITGRSNQFRLRVGDFRVIYSVHNQVYVIEVITIGNRGDVYK